MKISAKTHIQCGAYIGKFQLQITKYIFTSIAHKLTGGLKKNKNKMCLFDVDGSYSGVMGIMMFVFVSGPE